MERYFFDEHAQAIAKRQYLQEGDGDILGMFRRVAREIAQVEAPEARAHWEEKFYQLMASKRFSPGGRILAGAGTAHGNLLNCFVQGATDHLPESFEGVMEVARKLALVTKVGGGNGVNLDPYPPREREGRRFVQGVAYLRADHKDARDFVLGLMRPPTNPEGEKEKVALKNFLRVLYGKPDPELMALARENGVKVVDAPPEGAILVPDDMGGIVDAAAEAACQARSGRVPHVDFSLLRPEGSPIRGSGGTSSGPVSFLVELFDNFLEWASLGAEHAGPVATLRYVYAPVLRVVRQGGTRRGAGMATLSVDHGDVLDFLTAKDLDRERAEGDISTFNISILATEDFMEAVERDGLWPVHPKEIPGKYYPYPLEGEYKGMLPPLPEREDGAKAVPIYEGGVPARWLFREIAWHAWATGEPGLIFIDRVNAFSAVNGLDPEFVIRSTNPCFAGSVRISTEYGLVPIAELQGKGNFYVVTDNRAPLGGVGLPLRREGTTARKAAMAFFTGVKTVVRLATREGLELVLTPDHLLITPKGYKEAGSLRPGDRLLVQSGEGLFSKEDALPQAAVLRLQERVATAGGRGGRGRVDVKAKYANLPTRWSRELGVALGWLLGDGYLREDGVGFYFSKEDFRAISWLPDLLQDWFGGGSLQETPSNTYHLHFRRIPAEFFQALGFKVAKATEKRVPESIFRAPREAVVGFLQGLFSADGSVQINEKKQDATVRLASSSLGLLQDVQLLLLNLGIWGKIHKRRTSGVKALPDGRGGLKTYPVAEHYELILGAQNRDLFAEVVGFLQPEKQARLLAYLDKRRKGTYQKPFWATVARVEPAGEVPVYDLTEPVTHSLVANGIVAHNCGEIPLTVGEPCDLGALNLAAYVEGGAFNLEAFREDVHTAIRFLDNVLDVNRFALPDNEAKAKALRRLGLGVMGLADALIKMGLPYDSEEARAKVYEIISAMREEALRASEELAKERGPFPAYLEHEAFFREKGIPPRRNVALLTVAPTGTTSMIMGVSSGVEPVFSPFIWRRIGAEYKPLLHPLFKELMEAYPPAPGFEKDGGWDWAKVVEEIQKDGHGSVQNLPFIPEPIRGVFRSAHDISPLDHVRMQATVQRAFDGRGFAGNSISKTINLPNEASVDDVLQAYLEAHRTGCKGITVYRDGSREFQVLAVKKEDKAAKKEAKETPEPTDTEAPPKLPEPTGLLYERPGRLMGFTDMVKLLTPEGTKRSFLITVNVLEGKPIEVILTSGKAGDEANADSEALGRVVSIALQYGVPPEALVRTLRGISGGLYGTYQGRLVSSKADLIAVALETLPKDLKGAFLEGLWERPALSGGGLMAGETLLEGASSCPSCGEKALVREEGCWSCKACGYSKCG
ncbi:LAGLIDADG family homing endonuclease [Thermus sp.]|uniref:LAGLIDADG family homing endonuclease n=1 Tax=Thermus sp. TaxID=275 RepID=UPI00307DE36A